MDEIAKKLASLGLPGIFIALAASSTGGVGGTAGLVTAISGLGGPFGMVGGLAILGLITSVGDVLAGYGIESLLLNVYGERKKSESIHILLKEIQDIPMSDYLKQKIVALLESDDEESKSSPDTEPRTVEIVE